MESLSIGARSAVFFYHSCFYYSWWSRGISALWDLHFIPKLQRMCERLPAALEVLQLTELKNAQHKSTINGSGRVRSASALLRQWLWSQTSANCLALLLILSPFLYRDCTIPTQQSTLLYSTFHFLHWTNQCWNNAFGSVILDVVSWHAASNRGHTQQRLYLVWHFTYASRSAF